MRIKSLSDYQPAETGLVVLLRTSENLRPLPMSKGTAFFCFSEEELMLVDGAPAVLVDIPPESAIRILSRLVRIGKAAEYWAPRSDIANLLRLVEISNSSSEALAISGLHVSEAWIQLRIRHANGETRHADDFLRGLSAPYYGTTLMPHNYEQPPSAETLRAILISWTATLAKPVKKYLPKTVIVGLYKILERIR